MSSSDSIGSLCSFGPSLVLTSCPTPNHSACQFLCWRSIHFSSRRSSTTEVSTLCRSRHRAARVGPAGICQNTVIEIRTEQQQFIAHTIFTCIIQQKASKEKGAFTLLHRRIWCCSESTGQRNIQIQYYPRASLLTTSSYYESYTTVFF